jgi:hypothetical protein
MAHLASTDENDVRLIRNNKNTDVPPERLYSIMCVKKLIQIVQLQIQINPLTGLPFLSPFLAGTNSRLFA